MALYVNGKKVAGIGLPGKSAYQYAVDGGYTGTEEEFQEVLANANGKPTAHSVTLLASACLEILRQSLFLEYLPTRQSS